MQAFNSTCCNRLVKTHQMVQKQSRALFSLPGCLPIIKQWSTTSHNTTRDDISVGPPLPNGLPHGTPTAESTLWRFSTRGISSKPLIIRGLSSYIACHRCSKAPPVICSDASKPTLDFSIPNKAWSAVSTQAFEKLNRRVKEEPDKWEKLPTQSEWEEGEYRLFGRSAEQRQFIYSMFVNRQDRLLDCVVEFGGWAQGPPRLVHGGAISHMFDAAMGNLVHECVNLSFTVNLGVNFKKAAAIGDTFLLHSRINRIEGGRKIFSEAELFGYQDNNVYADATSIFIVPKHFLGYQD